MDTIELTQKLSVVVDYKWFSGRLEGFEERANPGNTCKGRTFASGPWAGYISLGADANGQQNPKGVTGL